MNFFDYFWAPLQNRNVYILLGCMVMWWLALAARSRKSQQGAVCAFHWFSPCMRGFSPGDSSHSPKTNVWQVNQTFQRLRRRKCELVGLSVWPRDWSVTRPGCTHPEDLTTKTGKEICLVYNFFVDKAIFVPYFCFQMLHFYLHGLKLFYFICQFTHIFCCIVIK